MARKPRIGMMGVTAQLYKKKIPEFVDNLSEQFTCFIQKCSHFADIIPSEISYTEELVEKSYTKMSQSDVDGIIIIFLSYSPSLIIEPVIKSRKLPVLIWNTQQLYEITGDFSSQDMMNNHGMHGVQDIASVLLRNDVPFTVITGHHSQKDTVQKIEYWCKCAAIRHDLKKLNIGRIGGRFKDMGDFAISDKQITDVIGPKIIEIKMSELNKAANSISPEEIVKVINQENKKFLVEKNLDNETREKSVRLELALRKLIDLYHLEALAINFMGFEGKNCTMPFAAISKFISEGVGYGGEGDVISATAVWVLQQIAPPATFTEMFTTDYKNNRIFMSHMGESNFKMAKNPLNIKLVKKDMGILEKGTATSMFLFQMKPGYVTLFNLAPCRKGNFRMIATTGYIEDIELFQDITSPHFLLKIANDVREFLSQYSNNGGTHHLAMVYGDVIEQIRILASIMGLEFSKI
ncbi:MAG TPA: hypothetical protein PK165_06910 [bacterium]|nr:hypothetical protein [bacterium]HOL49731.1 hypothetical protein [bacterium]HPO52543.1 hypothetical protein [bacterium]HXK44551.1 hypothetical protein [bacterium]